VLFDVTYGANAVTLSVAAVLVPLVEVVNPDEAVVVLMEVVPVAVNPVVAEELSSPLHARSRERGRKKK